MFATSPQYPKSFHFWELEGKLSQLDSWNQACNLIKDFKHWSKFKNFEKLEFLGYAGEAGVKRNQGDLEQRKGPNAIRKKMLGGLASI